MKLTRFLSFCVIVCFLRPDRVEVTIPYTYSLASINRRKKRFEMSHSRVEVCYVTLRRFCSRYVFGISSTIVTKVIKTSRNVVRIQIISVIKLTLHEQKCKESLEIQA